MLFQDELHEEFGTWPLAYIPYGGADFGEIKAVGQAVDGGDDSIFHTAWVDAANRLAAQAAEAKKAGHPESARELYLRASAFYSTSYHPLYGAPVDPRLLEAFRRQVDALNAGFALFEPAIYPIGIPFEEITLPAYFVPAEGRANEVRPLIILTNGYDATMTDLYFLSVVAASRRGYHCLMFDGPGQGALLYEQSVAMRPDWETVVKAVVNYAVVLPTVDAERIVLSGASLGGYLAPRAASGEHRIAALIADPGTWGIADGFRKAAVQMLGISTEDAADLGSLDDANMEKIESFVQANRDLRWKVVQRGFWVHGVTSMREFFREAELFTMNGRAELITCPTLLTSAEDDRMSLSAQYFYDSLRCKKELMRFRRAEGAGTHCEMQNRSLLNRRVLDWLDDLFADRS